MPFAGSEGMPALPFFAFGSSEAASGPLFRRTVDFFFSPADEALHGRRCLFPCLGFFIKHQCPFGASISRPTSHLLALRQRITSSHLGSSGSSSARLKRFQISCPCLLLSCMDGRSGARLILFLLSTCLSSLFLWTCHLS